MAALRWSQWLGLVLSMLISLVMEVSVGSGVLPSAAAAGEPADALPKAAESVGSYEMTPMHFLGVRVIGVAGPVVSQQVGGHQEKQRAAVIKGNLFLLYQPRGRGDQRFAYYPYR